MDFTIEELSMNAWPAIKTLLYDGWVIRLSNGYGNRANSINPIYPSVINLEEKLKYCADLFGRCNLPAAYKIIGYEGNKPCDEHRAIEEKLEGLNYQKINETSIQTCETMAKPRYEGIVVSNDFDDRWIVSVIEYNRIEDEHIPTFKKIVGNIAGEKIVVRREEGNEIAGCGYGAIGNDYVGVFDIVVKESFRGKGYGREIVETILSEAYQRGVKKSYLQVMINNPAALHLYAKLGYREIYRYWYRKVKR